MEDNVVAARYKLKSIKLITKEIKCDKKILKKKEDQDRKDRYMSHGP